MDRLVDVVQVADVILDAGQILGVLQEALHLGLGATVAELQVVQHRVVLFREALVRVLDHVHGRAHFVRVVGHVGDGHVRHFCSFLGVAAEGLEQGRREGRHGAHVVIGGHTRRLVGSVRCRDDGIRAVAEEGLDAAYVLLEGAHAAQSCLPEIHQAVNGPSHHLAAENAQRLLCDTRDLTHARLETTRVQACIKF